MSEVVVDDAMVERAVMHATQVLKIGAPRVDLRKDIREMLHVALTPPAPEPEIPVSAAMCKAARDTGFDCYNWSDAVIGYVYRAMERQRLKEVDKSPTPESAGFEYTDIRGSRRTTATPSEAREMLRDVVRKVRPRAVEYAPGLCYIVPELRENDGRGRRKDDPK